MHCKDPECLTGLSHRSIFRDPRGYVDIDPATCIGCFDCATQCPYMPITMVPKNGKTDNFDMMGTLRRTFSLFTPPPAPLALTRQMTSSRSSATSANTRRSNPQGARARHIHAKKTALRALLRVDPVKYFTEVDRTQGLIFRDQTQALAATFTRAIH